MNVLLVNRWIAISILLAALLVLVACGGDAEQAPAPEEPTTAPTEAPVQAPTEEPVAAGDTGDKAAGSANRLVHLFVDPPTIDPHVTTDATSARIIVEVFGAWSPSTRIWTLFLTWPRAGILATMAGSTPSICGRTPNSTTESR